MKIFTLGEERRLKYCRDFLSEAFDEPYRLLVLPIPSTKNNIHVKGTEITLADALGELSEGDAVAGYGLPESIREELTLRSVRVFDGAMCEPFLADNADLTVHGALAAILGSGEKSPADMKIGIIGYGRIGSRLLRALLFLGAKVILFTRSEESRSALGKEGVETAPFVYDGDYTDLDILVNTAPTKIMSEEVMRKCEEAGLKILDLASGECFPLSVSLNKMASVPEKLYPRSGGRLYAEYIKRFLMGEEKCSDTQ